MEDKSNIKSRTVLIELTPENLELLKKASEKEMRSQRNFIVSSAVKRAKELIRESNEV